MNFPIINYRVMIVAIVALIIAASTYNGNIRAQATLPLTPERVDPVRAILTQQKADHMAALLKEYGPEADNEIAAARSAAATRFKTLTDDEELMTIDVPESWNDIDSGTWVYKGQEVGFFLSASADQKDFDDMRSTAPGVFFGVSSTLYQEGHFEKIFGREKSRIKNKCKLKNRIKYKDAFYNGDYDFFTTCNRKKGHVHLVTLATPKNGAEYVILLRINVTKKSDLQAVAKIFESFQVLGDPATADQHNH